MHAMDMHWASDICIWLPFILHTVHTHTHTHTHSARRRILLNSISIKHLPPLFSWEAMRAENLALRLICVQLLLHDPFGLATGHCTVLVHIDWRPPLLQRTQYFFLLYRRRDGSTHTYTYIIYNIYI